MKAAKKKTKLFFMLPDDGSNDCCMSVTLYTYTQMDIDIVSVMGS